MSQASTQKINRRLLVGGRVGLYMNNWLPKFKSWNHELAWKQAVGYRSLSNDFRYVRPMRDEFYL